METGMKIVAQSYDAGRMIGVVAELNGERKIVAKVQNPFWPEIDAAYQAKVVARGR